LDNAKAAQAFP